jgi:hypothetical protein
LPAAVSVVFVVSTTAGAGAGVSTFTAVESAALAASSPVPQLISIMAVEKQAIINKTIFFMWFNFGLYFNIKHFFGLL